MLDRFLRKHDPDYVRRKALAEARSLAKDGVRGSENPTDIATAWVLSEDDEVVVVAADKGTTKVLGIITPRG